MSKVSVGWTAAACLVATAAAGSIYTSNVGIATSPRANGVESPNPTSVPRTVRANGYVVDLSLDEQLNFPGTTLAFEATVTEVLAPRYVQTQGFEYVYTPVVVTINQMHRGERPRDNKLVLRIFGGTANGVRYEAEFAPSEEVVNRGVKLLVLGPDPVVVAGDGEMAAMTPNGVHVISGNRVIDATHAPSHRHEERAVGYEQAREVLSAR